MDDRKFIEDKLEELQRNIDRRGAEVWKEIFILKNNINLLEDIIYG